MIENKVVVVILKPTIKDVAKYASVSTATVSRVLTNIGYASRETKEKVLKAVEELGYNPNAVARSLKRARTQTIGVIVPDISNPYFMRIIRAIEDCVSKGGYNLLLCSTDDNETKEETYLRILRERRVDGLILAPSRVELDHEMKPFFDENIPVVLIDRTISGMDVDTVSEENELASYRLIESLIDKGHESIAIINSKHDFSTGLERQRGYERALTDRGIQPNPDYIQIGRFDQETGYLSTKRLFALGGDRPTAIFATNNLITYGVLLALQEMMIRVPEDISLVSFGDLAYPELIHPRITAVLQHPERVGVTAADLLLHRLNTLEEAGESTQQKVILATELRHGMSVRSIRD